MVAVGFNPRAEVVNRDGLVAERRWNGSIVAPRRNGVLWFGNRGLKPTATIGCRSAAGTMAGGSLPYLASGILLEKGRWPLTPTKYFQALVCESCLCLLATRQGFVAVTFQDVGFE